MYVYIHIYTKVKINVRVYVYIYICIYIYIYMYVYISRSRRPPLSVEYIQESPLLVNVRSTTTWCSNSIIEDLKISVLADFGTDAPSELEILCHYEDTTTSKSTEIGILKQGDHVRLEEMVYHKTGVGFP